MWTNLKVDHGGKSFEDIEWDLELSERSVVETIPLLSEFPSYCDWGPKLRDGP